MGSIIIGIIKMYFEFEMIFKIIEIDLFFFVLLFGCMEIDFYIIN